MKFAVFMKTPDCLEYAIANVVTNYKAKLVLEGDDRDEYEIDEGVFLFEKELEVKCKQWFRHGESCQIEIDTEANTATVLPVK